MTDEGDGESNAAPRPTEYESMKRHNRRRAAMSFCILSEKRYDGGSTLTTKQTRDPSGTPSLPKRRRKRWTLPLKGSRTTRQRSACGASDTTLWAR